MKPEDCAQLDTCSKVKSLLDRELPSHADAIRAVCTKCQEEGDHGN